MKAKEYATQFQNSRRDQVNPESSLRIIFRDMVREANVMIIKKKCTKSEQIAEIFNIQNTKWRDMCVYLISFPINKNGFLQLLKDLEPRLYFQLIAKGLKRLPEDEEISKGDQNGLSR